MTRRSVFPPMILSQQVEPLTPSRILERGRTGRSRSGGLVGSRRSVSGRIRPDRRAAWRVGRSSRLGCRRSARLRRRCFRTGWSVVGRSNRLATDLDLISAVAPVDRYRFRSGRRLRRWGRRLGWRRCWRCGIGRWRSLRLHRRRCGCYGSYDHDWNLSEILSPHKSYFTINPNPKQRFSRAVRKMGVVNVF